jgi:aspartate/methionine/tyrosine aminotransferase
MKFSSLTERVKGGAADVWDSHYAAAEAQREGKDVIILSVGDPDFATPEPIVEVAVRSLREGNTHYTSSVGITALRESIASRHQRLTGVSVSKNNVAVTSGAQNALFGASMCICEAGDEVIVLQPMYVTYEATIQAPGATLVPVVLSAEDGFRLDAKRLESAITANTRAIFYASPSNPTGMILNDEELKIIAELAIQHDLWVVSDEVYSDIVFESQFHHIAALPGMGERTITIGSMSKSYAMTGWRTGWMVAPEAMIVNMDRLSLCMLYGLPGFVQEAASYALENEHAAVAEMREIYRRRRDLLFKQLTPIAELKVFKPDAGMFLMVDIRGTGLGTMEFVRQLYAATGVSVLDATAFGASAEGFVRISYATGEDALHEACQRIGKFIESLRPVSQAV